MAELPSPPFETMDGRLIGLPSGKAALLVVGRGKLPAGSKPIHSGALSLYFAFPMLINRDFMFPQLAVDDFRREYRGAAAIKFMMDKGNSYPRGDAVGMKLSDYQRGDFFMKEVDIAAGLRVFAFEGDLHAAPIVRVGAAVWLDQKAGTDIEQFDVGADGFALLQKAAPCYRCGGTALASLYEDLARQSNL